MKKEVLKLLEVRITYHISNSYWVSLVHVDIIQLWKMSQLWLIILLYRGRAYIIRGWSWPLEKIISSYMDNILERLIDQTYYFFLDGYSWHNQIDENQKYQENTIFTFSFDVFAYRRMYAILQLFSKGVYFLSFLIWLKIYRGFYEWFCYIW